MAAAQSRLPQSWADASLLREAGQGQSHLCQTGGGGRSAFLGPVLQLAAGCPQTRQTRSAPPQVCRALGLPEAVSGLVAAGVSAVALPCAAVLGPLASLDSPAQWRALAAASVSLWYLTAKPGPLQGVFDIMWAPVAEKGATSFSPASITLGKQLGEGSFGVVYEGFAEGPLGREHVVLKKVKAKVLGAEEMRTSELYFNQRLHRTARGTCAHFLGTCRVNKKTQKGKLVEGVWLVWRYQGSSNLESLLRGRDFPGSLAADMLGERGLRAPASKADRLQRDCAVVQEVTRQILDCLKGVHSTGVVHRDIKPLNLVLDEETLRFTLVDLGACVDLRSGYNYVPDETIMDPIYCAPEQYILPINMPDAPPGPLMSLLAPLLFLAHSPDKFDLFSMGLVLMQLAVPSLRFDRNLAQFNVQLAASGYNLDKWRRSKLTFPESDLEILDANGGAGWDLARSLLRPRVGLWCERPTAANALKHRFLTQPLRWATDSAQKVSKSGKKRAASASGKKKRELALAPALSFGLGLRSQGEQSTDPATTSGGGYSLPFLNRSRSGPKLADAGAKFDRKVKLKARQSTNEGPQSAVAWSALLPLRSPFNARPQLPPEQSSEEPLQGLKRLVGLDTGSLPAPPRQVDVPPEFPHVTALAQLLGQAFLHQQVPVGLQPLGAKQTARTAEDGTEGQGGARGGPALLAASQGLAQAAVPLAAASAAVVTAGATAVVAVKASVETGYSVGQGLMQTVGGALALAGLYLYVLRPGLAAASRPPRSAFSVDPLPLTPLTRQAGGGPVLPPAGQELGRYTNWIVNRGTDKLPTEKAVLLHSVREMESQLASLEATIRGGREFNVAQKQLLSRVESLLLESTLRPANGQTQVP